MIRLRMGKSKFNRVTFNGGPWQELDGLVPGTGTFVFSLYGMHGSYDGNGLWHPVRRSLI